MLINNKKIINYKSNSCKKFGRYQKNMYFCKIISIYNKGKKMVKNNFYISSYWHQSASKQNKLRSRELCKKI